MSDLIYCYLGRYKRLLTAESIPEFCVVTVGNIIVDALCSFLSTVDKSPVLNRLGIALWRDLKEEGCGFQKVS